MTAILHRPDSTPATVPLLPVKLGPMFPSTRIPTLAVYRNGRQIAEISKVAGRWLVNVSGLGVSIHEPNHATAAAALTWHGWKEG